MTDLAPASRRPHPAAGGLARWFGAGDSGDALARRAEDSQTDARGHGAGVGLTIAVTETVSSLEADWRRFEETAVASYAQSYDWVAAWSTHVAPARAARPVIVTGRSGSGALAFIWPFGVHRRFGRTVLQWLGQEESGYGMGLYAPTFAKQVTPSEMAGLFRDALKAIGGIDAVDLSHQPEQWAGCPNPMLGLASKPSADLAYELALDADFETIYRRAFGKRSRTTYKRKERRLGLLGTVDVRTAETPADRQEVLGAFFEQKARQFAVQGIKDVFAEPETRAFYLDLAGERADRAAPLACWAMTVDGETAATVIGMRFQDRFNLLMASLTDTEVRRWSPGALLMRDQIAACCEAGCTHYDLGLGWGRHKEEWGAQPIRLFDTLLAVRPGGILVTVPARLRLRLKRTIKSNKVLWDAFQKVRRRVFGTQEASNASA